MSDETNKNETNKNETNKNETNRNEGWTAVGNTGTAGFCQDCGRPLTPETARPVGTSLFCEPCLQVRVGAAGQPGAAYTAGTVPPPPVGAPRPVSASEPHPVLAGLLGIIPGVGAIYNGQFAKGFVHLIIFAVLISFADHVSSIFDLFVFGWVCYQVVDAYQTAIARRDGLALPNPFGLNDIGERMGFGKSWGVVPPAATSTAAPGVPVGSSPDWVGYVPPDAIPVAPPVVGSSATIYAQQSGPMSGQTPYANTYTGTPYGGVSTVVVSPTRRFPIGAFWLIGLGVLILLGNFLPDIRITGHWFLPVFFAGLSIFIFTRRMHSYGTSSNVCYLRWPVTLMVLAILFALQAAYVATLGQTWPVLLVTIGGLLLLERTVGVAPVTPYVAHEPAGPVVEYPVVEHKEESR